MKRRLSVSFFHHDTSVCVQFYMYEGLGKVLVLVILYLTIAPIVRVRSPEKAAVFIYHLQILYHPILQSHDVSK
jgi:hypothetical protein